MWRNVYQKGKLTFPTTRVVIVVDVHNIGKPEFWKQAFHTFSIPLDSNLSDILHGQDVCAGKKRVIQNSNEGRVIHN